MERRSVDSRRLKVVKEVSNSMRNNNKLRRKRYFIRKIIYKIWEIEGNRTARKKDMGCPIHKKGICVAVKIIEKLL